MNKKTLNKNNKKNKEMKIEYELPWTIENIDDIDYGRYFGKWKCLECKNHWSSAYTWISLDFCEKNSSIFKDKKGKYWFSGKNLKDKDFLLEKCRNCEDSKNSNVTLLSYNNLEGGSYVDNKIPHHTELCAKCLKGYPCHDKD
jgi:hypothetical protein